MRIHRDLGTADVIVPDFQLSLAIGKEGQNARLAHRLTGLRIDIRSETEDAQSEYQPYGESADYADGEWVVDEATGDQMWQPADGSDPISLDEWNKMNAEGEAAAEPEGETAAEPEADGGADSEDAPDGDAPADTDDGDIDEAAIDQPGDEAAEADETT